MTVWKDILLIGIEFIKYHQYTLKQSNRKFWGVHNMNKIRKHWFVYFVFFMKNMNWITIFLTHFCWVVSYHDAVSRCCHTSGDNIKAKRERVYLITFHQTRHIFTDNRFQAASFLCLVKIGNYTKRCHLVSMMKTRSMGEGR